MTETAKLELQGNTYELPLVHGTEDDRGIDISKLRSDTGYITLDDAYGNTGSCRSAITYIDGDKGILRYRGISIEDLAARSSFVEVAWLLIFGKLPPVHERARFTEILEANSMIDETMHKHFDAFAPQTHPMAILSAMINTLSAYTPEVWNVEDDSQIERLAAVLMSKVRTIAAAAYKSSIGEPIVYPRYDLPYAENFLHMMFTKPYKEFEPSAAIGRALSIFLVLHADHEQNCSTSTVRMVASGKANMFASCAAGVCALWGPLHGGANQAAVEMLQQIVDSGMTVAEYVAKVKDKQSGIKLMGFGHRVYRNFDPRSKIIRNAVDDLLAEMKTSDPLLDIAQELAETALADDYFVERKLYPNVDFYSGIMLRAMGIPENMFTAMFAMGRMPGWIANWKEVHDDAKGRIYRPRQIYVGKPETAWVEKKAR